MMSPFLADGGHATHQYDDELNEQRLKKQVLEEDLTKLNTTEWNEKLNEKVFNGN